MNGQLLEKSTAQNAHTPIIVEPIYDVGDERLRNHLREQGFGAGKTDLIVTALGQGQGQLREMFIADDMRNPSVKRLITPNDVAFELAYTAIPSSLNVVVDEDTNAAHELTESTAWRKLINVKHDFEERSESLAFLIHSNRLASDQLAQWLIDELNQSEDSRDWQAELISAIEAVHLPVKYRSIACEILLTTVRKLRSNPSVTKPIVYSALRRGVSLLEPSQVGQLLDFLDNSYAIDTRAVSLQSISRLYHRQPPEKLPEQIADRVVTLGTKYLDPDVFQSGEMSFLARYAVAATAVLGDHRLSDLIQQVQSLRKTWLNRRLVEELKTIRKGWDHAKISTDNPSYRNLIEGIEHLSD